jgi:tetratricopeptide (TPR) repeat protein/predicted aspartyl protease
MGRSIGSGARRRRAAALVLGLGVGLVLASAPALAACQIGAIAGIPVTVTGRRAVVTAQINGGDARFILDSGAFYSTIAKATAMEYGLSVRSLGTGARLRGIGGDASLGVATAKEFRIAGQVLPHIDFAVGGSDTGYAGLLGQNILGVADAEYDLPHGMVRLMRGKDCRDASMGYWAGPRPVTTVQIETLLGAKRHTIGTISVNGVKLKAMFDTGAPNSTLTLAAAKRLGVTPDSPGVTAAGFATGLGQGQSRAWRARFESINIGGEEIRRPWLGIADKLIDGPDMIIGVDFFLTHRIYVDNQNHRMWITYEGGPMFGLTPKGAVDNSGAALDLTDKAGEPTDAAGYSRRGGILAARRDYEAALADFDKAVAMDPGQVHYLVQRATAHLANRQPLLGAADLDKAIALAPGDGDARLARASLRLGARDPAGALVDLKAADQALAPSSDARRRLAAMFSTTDAFEPAVASYDLWLKSHPEDHDRAAAFNGRCWARALLDRDLDKALSDCDAALRSRPGVSSYLDSRALVRFRRGEFDKALVDYDAALAAQPREAWSLYMRALTARRLGKTAQADADRTAALAINPGVAARAKRYRLE